MQRPKISSTAFWDINFDNLDFDGNSLFVMEKVFNYGTWSDMLETLRFYGLDRIKHEIVQASFLKSNVLSFLSVILDLQEADFKAYQRMKARESYWKPE